ncbi:nitrilase-related carbon-nitrogen hydrolase, partial [Cupriavidus basilensis]
MRRRRSATTSRFFHNQLSMQAGAYQNGTWVVGVAKAGMEEGVDGIGGSCIIKSALRRREVLANCITKGDEVAIARCDLDFCEVYKRTTFNFDAHRQPQAYAMIVERRG